MTAAPRDVKHEPVAIVGIGCRFPGGINDPASFWRALVEGRDAITEIPADRIDLARWFDARPATPGRMMTRWGAFLDRIDEFDALAFGISPREAERMDPQQRLLLEVAWEALEDAGQDISSLDGSRTGVFVGQWLSDFEGRLFADAAGVDFYMTTGSGRYATSGRLSYTLGLRGPSITLDTACSSSLVAVHLAVQSLRSGESDLALAGGVNIILQPQISIAYSQSLMMAPDGRCKFGDADGDGYVRSEGAGVIVLKPLARALAAGDRIYALIRGSAVNNDGKSSGSLGTPSQLGQEELLRTAYADAGVPPHSVSYVEAHGTGTRVGDPVELGAIGTVMGTGRSDHAPCAVGSVKTNFGHTEGAAGIAGLIKAALALRHGAIPPSLHLKRKNPAVPWTALRLDVPTALVALPQSAAPHAAGVSAFGIGGTNAHIVLEQLPPQDSASSRPREGASSILVLSAKTREALSALAALHAAQLEGDGAAALHDICWTAATRRSALQHRASLIAADSATLANALRRYAAGEPVAAEGDVPHVTRAKVVFLCPGQGAQWVGMGRELARQEPVFRNALEACDRAARPYADWSIVEQLHSEPGSSSWRLDDIGVIQPVLVALSIAYAELWRSLGVTPDAVVGHSMGEVAAAHIAGVLDLDQAMRIICRRSALMRRASGRGAMLLVELSFDEARARIAGQEAALSVAVSNSPRSSVISGDPAAIQRLQEALERERLFCRLIKVDVASHSPQMEPLARELAAELGDVMPRAARIPIYSTVTGARADGTAFDAEYWAANLRKPVQFAAATKALIDDGFTAFVELGPHPVLLPSVEQTGHAAGTPVRPIACGRRDENEPATFLEAIGTLWTAGAPPDWSRVMPEGGRAVRLPSYPWQRERHWVDAAEMRAGAQPDRTAAVTLDAEALRDLYTLRWQAIAEPPAAGSAAGTRWIIAASERAHAAALAAENERLGGHAVVVTPGELAEALTVRANVTPTDAPTAVVVMLDESADASYAPLRALQAILASPGRPRLWLVTSGAQAADDGKARRVNVEQAAAWGTGRVIAEEHPELWGGLIDVDPARPRESAAESLVRHMLGSSGEDQVALRDGRWFALRLVRGTRDTTMRPYAWRADCSYLVTGGLGEIALRIARTMVEGGARRLVLLGRTPLPPRGAWGTIAQGSDAARRVTAVRELEALGASVHVASVDVGDEPQLRAFLDRHAAEAWPPIRGVVHAAGVLENHLASTMDRAQFEAGLRAKLRGAQMLDALLPDAELFVLFSSTSAFLAQAGQANYAAANAGLDALAHDRRARGRSAVSIEWGVWANTGLVRGEAGERNVAEMARQGIRAFAPERGAALFAVLCATRDATVAALPIDWRAFGQSRPGRDAALFRDVEAGEGARGARNDDLRGRLVAAGLADRKKIIEPLVRETIGRVLKIAPARLDARKALGTMGLNSLMAMELRNRLEAALGRPLSATLAWNYPTVDALVAHLADGDAGTPAVRPASPAQQPAAGREHQVSDVTKLSDDEAARALRAGRRRAAP